MKASDVVLGFLAVIVVITLVAWGLRRLWLARTPRPSDDDPILWI